RRTVRPGAAPAAAGLLAGGRSAASRRISAGGRVRAVRPRTRRNCKRRQKREGRCGRERSGLRNPGETRLRTAFCNLCRNEPRRTAQALSNSARRREIAPPGAKFRRKFGRNRGKTGKKGRERLIVLLEGPASRLWL